MQTVHFSHLTDEEALKRLITLLVRDAALEDKLATAEAQVAQYCKLRRALQKDIYYQKAIIAPVRGLPVEILGHIFGFLVGSAPDTVLHASQVCRVWRSAAILFSHLWSNIIVTSESSSALEKARLFLERSGQAPLAITFVQSNRIDGNCPAWYAIKSSAQRWSSLSLTLDNCRVASHEIRSLPAVPGLTELSVAIRGRCANPGYEGLFGFEPDKKGRIIPGSLAGSPYIKTLRLSTFIIPSLGPLFSGLTTLSITDSFAMLENPGPNIPPIKAKDLFGLLKTCHNLEEFTFDAEATVPWFVQHSVDHDGSAGQNVPIALPRLRSFHFHCHHSYGAYLLPRLCPSNLETASLRMQSWHIPSANEELEQATLSFLKRCQNLRTLRVLAYRGAAIIAALEHGLHYLESLHMEHSPDPDIVVRALGMSYRFNNADSKNWLAPRLSTLVIDTEEFLLNLINVCLLMERYSSHIQCGIPNALGSLIVNGHDMLKDMPPGKIAQFRSRERFISDI